VKRQDAECVLDVEEKLEIDATLEDNPNFGVLMLKIPASRLLLATSLLALPASLWSFNALAAPSKASKTRLAKLPKSAANNKAIRKGAKPTQSSKALPRYVSMKTIKQLQKQAKEKPLVALQPMWEGHALKTPMRDLLTGPTLDVPAVLPVKNKKSGADPMRIAQAFPRSVAPASPAALRRAASNATPRWVRYPLEFQLAGIGLGTRAVDKDRFNRIDRYGLFALHGNPTAVVRSVIAPGGGAGGEGGSAPGGAPGGGLSAPGGLLSGAPGAEGGAGAAPPTGNNLTMQQTPPETAALFPQSSPGGGLPDWALAITVKLDNNHVEWLYKRETYSMGFVVDRLGFVDAIIVAGLESPITRTQLEDPIHTVKLGDDLRKVLFRYGYPDDLVPLAADPPAVANDTTGAPGGGGAGAGAGGSGGGGLAAPGGPTGALGGAGAAGAGAAPGGDQGTNAAFRTYDLRYEQSYNVVFTIRNNRVVRIYIFGDPDFFNAQRRRDIRTKY
jgi:hypothetical protein